ncbi:MAG: acyl-CoA dehydrogenase family protein [Frankiaceae bacterium]|nr:acyl-CoA dehydrogenase family protein [Frankiaceae bacterium]MBV9870750.1 acyl-CoA dehydrogenase family protein [Frankiaceae bacterium]
MSTDVWTTPERAALRAAVRDFCTKEIVPHLDQWERDGEVPRTLHKAAAEAGLLGVAFPEEAGGQGGSIIDQTIVSEELLYAGASSGLLSALFTHGIAIPHLVKSGNADLIDRYAKPTLNGDLIGSLAVTEPDAGSDVAAIRTRAVREGDRYIVNGAKTFITSSTRADFVTTVVRTGEDPHRGISLLVVDTGSPGFSVVRRLEKMGWLCSDTGELAYVDVRVPAANLIGEEGSGFIQVAQQFAGERLGLAVHGYGIAQRALDLTVAYTRQRNAFGRPLISKQVVRHKLVEMTRAVEVSRTYARSITERIAAGEQLFAEAAMAKNQAIEACSFVVNEAVQLHGGSGYMRETEVERHYRDARILGIGGGATEVMNDLIAKALFG